MFLRWDYIARCSVDGGLSLEMAVIGLKIKVGTIVCSNRLKRRVILIRLTHMMVPSEGRILRLPNSSF